MLRQFSLWVWLGAWTLAFAAGMVNAVGFLGFTHQAITHLTGVTTSLGIAAANADLPTTLHLLAVPASFVAGAALAGYVVRHSTLRLGRRYGLTLLAESALLCAAVPLLKSQNPLGIYLTSCACGLQNAMASSYSGSTIRTTHLSGMFTDLGIFLGHRLAGLPVDPLRLRLCFLIISAFLLGSSAGACAFHRLHYNALYLPASLAATLALAYALYRRAKRHA